MLVWAGICGISGTGGNFSFRILNIDFRDFVDEAFDIAVVGLSMMVLRERVCSIRRLENRFFEDGRLGLGFTGFGTPDNWPTLCGLGNGARGVAAEAVRETGWSE